MPLALLDSYFGPINIKVYGMSQLINQTNHDRNHRKLSVEIMRRYDTCCDMGQNDTFRKIELIPLSVLSTDNTNC